MMRQNAVPALLLVAVLAGCSDSDEPLRGWEENDVEVIEAGETGDTARQVVAPGEVPMSTPMTGTNLDTSTDLDMIDDESLSIETEATGVDQGTLAERIEGNDRTGTTTRTPSRPRPSTAMQERQTRRESPRPDPPVRQTEPAPISPPSTATSSQNETGSREPEQDAAEREQDPVEDTERSDPAETRKPHQEEAEPPATSTQQESDEDDEPPIIDQTPGSQDDSAERSESSGTEVAD